MDNLVNIELDILNSIQNIFKCSVCDSIFKYITHLGDAGIVWIVTAVILLFFKKTRKTGICMGIALLLGVFFGNLILKNIIARERPYTYEDARMTAESVSALISLPHDYSFPSGHTLASFGSATAIFMNSKKYGIIAYIAASLIAFSRMYLYVHFPTDILGGIILGIIFGVSSFYLTKKLFTRFEKKIS
ncbi:MAG: phosphatase PAP2 family protein [Clostridia bacterium]|nr:phosphatase PAP2 family protein [Clostridia bacterium]